ncbi:MAG: ABC transporter permease [Clostridiales bacterium]|nr:ABC transporter permease [Clostridiales bacterium]
MVKKKTNPLNKRFLRELKSEAGKYIVLFVFIAGVIALVSGFLVASGSMSQAYDESFEKYNIEDGNFEVKREASSGLLDALQKDGTKIYPNFYKEEQTKNVESTLRIFKKRTEIDLECLMEGSFPEDENEIAIDRMYAVNNKISVGDVMELGDVSYTICGLVALSDYSALFSSMSDMMFDAVRFGVAIVTEDGFNKINDDHLHYNYSWRYSERPADEKEAKTLSESFLKTLYVNALLNLNGVEGFIPEYVNQAIIFTGDDIKGDNAMFTVFLYIVIAIIAFVFAVTTSNTINKESAVIGTLRASGYSKGELIRHYMAALYYASYSLPTYVTIWNADAFVKTTVIPVLLMFAINFIMLAEKMSLSPLRFLRRDLSRRQKKKAFRLKTTIPIMKRFRMRILFQNIPNYVILFIGILFANLILLFGFMFGPLLDHFEQEITTHLLAEHQYVLVSEEKTENKEAESYDVTVLKTQEGRYKSEEVMVYGVQENSAYIKSSLSDDEVLISNAYANKQHIKVGDTITLQEEYGEKTYSFTVTGIYTYPAALSVFMNCDAFEKTFEKGSYYPGYFSNEELTDLTQKNIAMTISKEDLTKTSRQLRLSMGGMAVLFQGFGVIMFALLLYLLSKVVIEKNVQSISMAKILGYSDKEINRLYIRTTTIVSVVSLIVTIGLCIVLLKAICEIVFAEYSGYLEFYMEPADLLKVLAAGLITYAVISFFQIKKIKAIPMTDALKNVE